MIILTGNSVTLRSLQERDASQLCQIVNQVAIRQAMVTIKYPFSEADALALIQQSNSEHCSRFAVQLKDQMEMVGCISLLEIDKVHLQAELSFFISAQAGGKGLTTEAGRIALRYAFTALKLNRLYALHLSGNVASAKVLEKLGFTIEGVLRDRVRKNNHFYDVTLLSLLRREFVE